LLSRVLRILQNRFVGAHQGVFDMTNGKCLVGASGRRASDFSELLRRFCSGVGVCCERLLPVEL
jgi:hypothetical protein